MEPREIAASIGVELLGRLPHGEGTGAYEVRTPDGTAAVMKLLGDDAGNSPPDGLVETLRARGYPIPEILGTGRVAGQRFEIQQVSPGEPIEQAAERHLGSVHALIELQLDVGVSGPDPWLDAMIASVVEGRAGYCEHAAMRAHSAETRALLERLCRIADAAHGADVRTGDAVHFDFSPYNILVRDDRITGVVDWDGATVGDAAFDLVTLALYTYDYAVRDALLAGAGARAAPAALALYAAHMVLRQVDWSLRHHDATAVEWFLGTGIALLAAVGAG